MGHTGSAQPHRSRRPGVVARLAISAAVIAAVVLGTGRINAHVHSPKAVRAGNSWDGVLRSSDRPFGNSWDCASVLGVSWD